MRALILFAVIGASFWAYNDNLFHRMNAPEGAFAEDGSARILLFTTPECDTPCTLVKNELHKRRATYTEIEVSLQDDDENTERWEKLGFRGFPVLVAGAHANLVADGPEVASVLAMSFGDKHLNSNEKKLYKKHFNDYDEPIVVMYGADWCPYCQKLQKELKEDKITFVEIDVPKHRDGKSISKTMDIRGYPTTWFGFHRVKGIDIKSVKRTMRIGSDQSAFMQY